jgi:hypothetical protein
MVFMLVAGATGLAGAATGILPSTAGNSGGAEATSMLQLPATCDPADPPSCLYTSDLHFDVGVVRGVSLTDHDRDDYEIPLLIRYPRLDRAERRPVVIWNHGGAPSPRGATRSAEWGNLLAAAGYVVIHPSRMPIADATPFRAECRANGIVATDECTNWVAQFRYGPQTTHFLVEHLADVAALDPALTRLLDPQRIVLAGHSAGSSVPLANAGAWQQFVTNGPRYDERDDAPMAFLVTGVQGPTYAGFRSGFQPGEPEIDLHSFTGIDRPLMSITGVGDETGEPPESRVTAWLTAQPTGDTYLSWDTDRRAVHETMDIHKCDTSIRAAHCRWIGSAGLAFLDGIVRRRPAARQWLASDAYRVLTRGAIELQSR